MTFQVELKNLKMNYGDFCAVDKINLNIEKGEIVSLLGPSGCGKTTTLRIIAGLITETGGSVFIEQQKVSQIPPFQRDIAMVFQNYALFPHLTVFENIVYGLRTKKIRDKKVLKKKAQEVIGIVQLEGTEDRYPRQLSGGQQQRVSLARALIVNPKVMLFDEPLSNLDAKLREQTRVEIRELLKRMNVTAIYVTHDQEEALSISDRIAVMNHGRIEQVCAPEDIYYYPKTRFVADFIGHANFFDGTVSGINGDFATLETREGALITFCANGQPLEIDEKISLMIRPENIELTCQAQACANAFEATVFEKSFLGSIIRYMVELAGAKRIEIDVHPDNEVKNRKSDQVFVCLPAKKLVVLKQ